MSNGISVSGGIVYYEKPAFNNDQLINVVQYVNIREAL